MKRAMLTSVLAHGYTGLVGFIFYPLYLRHLGAEAFGLIGLFVMLQAWMQILDLGLTPTLSREMSLFRAGRLTTAGARQRLRTLEWTLGVAGLVVAVVTVTASGWIAAAWLQPRELQTELVAKALTLMATAAVLRWLTGLYRGALVGLERQVWVNAASVAFATAKFAGVVPVLMWAESPLLTFFWFQTAIAGLELSVFASRTYRCLPGKNPTFLPSLAALRVMWPVASAMAFLAGIWIFVSNIDRLILSKLLPLAEFGYYTLAVSLAASLLMVVPPLHQVIQPRLTVLVSRGRISEVQTLYETASQVLAVALAAAAGTLALFGERILWVWTGDIAMAHAAAPILVWYSLANAVAALLTMPFLLQFAFGYLRLHVVGNVILGLVLLPALAVMASSQGAVGTGITLLIAHLLFMLVWVPRAHARLIPELTIRWPLKILLPAVVVPAGVVGATAALSPDNLSPLETALTIGSCAVFAVVAGTLVCPRPRRLAWDLVTASCRSKVQKPAGKDTKGNQRGY